MSVSNTKLAWEPEPPPPGALFQVRLLKDQNYWMTNPEYHLTIPAGSIGYVYGSDGPSYAVDWIGFDTFADAIGDQANASHQHWHVEKQYVEKVEPTVESSLKLAWEVERETFGLNEIWEVPFGGVSEDVGTFLVVTAPETRLPSPQEYDDARDQGLEMVRSINNVWDYGMLIPKRRFFQLLAENQPVNAFIAPAAQCRYLGQYSAESLQVIDNWYRGKGDRIISNQRRRGSLEKSSWDVALDYKTRKREMVDVLRKNGFDVKAYTRAKDVRVDVVKGSSARDQSQYLEQVKTIVEQYFGNATVTHEHYTTANANYVCVVIPIERPDDITAAQVKEALEAAGVPVGYGKKVWDVYRTAAGGAVAISVSSPSDNFQRRLVNILQAAFPDRKITSGGPNHIWHVWVSRGEKTASLEKAAWEVEPENLKAPDLETHVKPWQCWKVDDNFNWTRYLYFGPTPSVFQSNYSTQMHSLNCIMCSASPDELTDEQVAEFLKDLAGEHGNEYTELLPANRNATLISSNWQEEQGKKRFGDIFSSLKLSEEVKLKDEGEQEHYKPHEIPEKEDLEDIHKESLGELGKFVVWVVNGSMVRDKIDPDFVSGGNPSRYGFVPVNEIWLEQTDAPDDMAATLLHEYTEACLMQSKDWDYEKAHEASTEVEKRFRKSVTSLQDLEDIVPAVQKFVASKQASLKLAWEVEDSTPETDSYGTTRWYNSAGQLHRTDGPAVEWANGTKEWWVNDKLHRTDGPAIEYANGRKAWYVNGKLHRTDGPAVELADGSKAWYVNGRELTEEEFNRMHQASLKLSWEVEPENLKAPDLETHVKPWQCWEIYTETDRSGAYSFQSYLYLGAHPEAYPRDVAMAIMVEDALEQIVEPTLKGDTDLLGLMHRFDEESQRLSGSPMAIVTITRSVKLIADDWRPVGYGFRNASLRLTDRFGNMNPGILDIQKRYLEGTATMHNTTQGVAL